jgi:hypothetical protein
MVTTNSTQLFDVGFVDGVIEGWLVMDGGAEGAEVFAAVGSGDEVGVGVGRTSLGKFEGVTDGAGAGARLGNGVGPCDGELVGYDMKEAGDTEHDTNRTAQSEKHRRTGSSVGRQNTIELYTPGSTGKNTSLESATLHPQRSKEVSFFVFNNAEMERG